VEARAFTMYDARDVTVESLEQLAARAASGDRHALEQVVSALKDDVFGLAMRMLGHPADAQDATQDILIRIVTHLGSFRGESALRTWAWRIAANYLKTCLKGRYEHVVSGFASIDPLIAEGETLAPVDLPEAQAAVLADEVKLGCLSAIMLALDRDERMAYTLAEVYGLTGEEASVVLEIEPAAFRKRLSRARQALAEYMGKTCGLVSREAACSCRRQIPVHLKHDFVRPERLVYLAQQTRARGAGTHRASPETLKAFAYAEKVAETFRATPDYAAPSHVIERIRAIISDGTLELLS
jgi:RNA polymerase sigma factor (sigma-70 family)